MVLYRPHHGSLDDSMELMRTFENTDDMIKYVQNDWYDFIGECVCTINDESADDARIGWHNTHYVLINGNCVGMCNLEE